METPVRILIDFATGDNWEMPLALYEKYCRDCGGTKPFRCSHQTLIEYWINTLSDEEKGQITKK